MLRRAARRRVMAWCAAAGLAVVVHDIVSDADTRRDSWGRTTTVVVASRRIEAGTLLDTSVLASAERPLAALPDDTLTGIDPGQRATRSIERGEELTSADVAPSGRSPLASQLEPGRAAVVLQLGDVAPAIDTGDHVDVVTDVEASPVTNSSATVVAHSATVISTDGDTAVLSVAEAEAAATAHAALVGGISIVVRR
ncbi:MAG: SAF domain-containing protein [Microthrixaceae bacterium]